MSQKYQTRLFVTNSLSFLPQCDEIAMLEMGNLTEKGSYDSLIENNSSHFANFVQNHNSGMNQDEEFEKNAADLTQITKISKSQQLVETNSATLNPTDTTLKEREISNNTGEKLIEKEYIESGKVKFSTFIQYARACTFTFMGFFVLNYIMMYICQAFSGIWLSEWSNSYLDNDKKVNKEYYLLIYCLIGIGQRKNNSTQII